MKLGSIIKYGFGLAFLAFGRYPISYLVSSRTNRKKPELSRLKKKLLSCPSGNIFAVSFDGLKTGHTIVFLHGLNASSEQWQYQRHTLKNHYRLVLIDLPGHGAAPPSKTMAIDVLTEDLHFLLQQFDIQNPYLYGHSIGAMMAMQYAITYRHERIKGLILQQGSFTNPLMGCAFPALMRSIEKPIFVPLLKMARRCPHFFRGLAWLNYSSGLSSFFYRYLLFSGRQSAAELRLMCKLAAHGSVLSMVDGLLATLNFDVRDSLRDIKVPTLVIAGRQDRLVDVPTSYFIARSVQNGRLRLLQSGHLSIIEDPSAVNRHLVSFLADFRS